VPTITYGFMKHREVLRGDGWGLYVFDQPYRQYIKPNLLFYFINFFSSQMNNFVIFFVLGSINLANCEAVRMLLIPLHITILAMGNVLVPYFSNNIRILTSSTMKKNFQTILAFFFVVFAAASILVISSGPFLLGLFFQGKYDKEIYLLPIFVGIYLFDGMNCLITCYLKARGLMHIGVRIRTIFVLISVVLLFPFVARFREAGALLVTMMSGIFLFFSYFRALSKAKLV
jgi:O-antigen/teichoic acid export membrane protein